MTLSKFNWRDEDISSLVLGTAQFGMDYGIANESGRPSQARVKELIQHFSKMGGNMLDTAQAYGHAQRV